MSCACAELLEGFPAILRQAKKSCAGPAENAAGAAFSKAWTLFFMDCAFLIKVLSFVCRERPPKIWRRNCKKYKVALV
jgi:hypothetical protein